MALNITHNDVNGVSVVHLSGAIFFDEESTFLRIKCEGPVGQIASNRVGFRESHSIDSSGLGTLVALHVSARKIGGNIKLANLGYHIKEALRITRLVTVFDIFDRTEDAVASFNGAAAAG
jgi:anti-anti-sigma factor